MRIVTSVLVVAGLALPLLTGCTDDQYYRAAPQPNAGNYYRGSDLGRMAHQNGYRDGFAEGAHDQHTGHSFKPNRDDKFEDCPGYYDELGPHDEYKRLYRNAYRHGYHDGYNRG